MKDGKRVIVRDGDRHAVKLMRCGLVPADGFYEWQRLGKGKIPMRVRMKAHRKFNLTLDWRQKLDYSMRQDHRGGEKLFVDSSCVCM
jgi:hypothetical protein